MNGPGSGDGTSFTTARLRLDPTRERDLDSLHALWTEPGVRRYLWDDVIIPREKAEETLRASLASFARDGFGLWVLRLTGDQDLIGFAGLRRIAELPLEVELLYGLHPRFWKRGLATEASAAVLERGFARHGRERIWARADGSQCGLVPSHEASWHDALSGSGQRIGDRLSCDPSRGA